MKSNPLLKAALAYAKRGWRVFPILAVTQTGGCECGDPDCSRPGKHPAIQGWPAEATTSRAQIEAWWGERPDRGIGIATGEESNLTVLDVDGEEGIEELGKLAGPEGMPRTATSQSRPGRFHYYFTFKEGVGSRAKKIAPHLDSRSEGGYVVAPPSRHASGSTYTWLIEAELAEWPDFLSGKRKAKTAERFTAPQRQKLKSALAELDPDDEERWAQVGWILGRAFKQSDEGFALYSAWAGRSRKYDPKRTRGHYYDRSQKPHDRPLTVEAIYTWAHQAGWAWDEMELRPGELPQVIEDCSKLLADAGVHSRGGKLVALRRVAEAGLPDDDIRRDPAQLVIVSLTPEVIRVILQRRKTFKRGRVIVDFPMDYARTLAAMGEWRGVPELRGIADAPTMRRDGTIVQAPGYDARSGLYLNLEGEWPKVPETPTKAHAQKALATLLAPFEEFPFEDDAARAAFLAALLGTVIRHTLRTAPANYFIAPTAASGKTLLVDAIAIIASGQTAPKRMLPQADDAEMRKVITSSLAAGDRLLAFDNIPRGHTVRSPSLDAALTSEVWADRLLKTNDTLMAPFTLSVFITGNNISCHTDAVRRGIFTRIDPKCELPEERAFKRPDLLGYLRQHRPALLVAALTILRAYAVAKDRVTLTPLGSFEDWSRRVREAVVWIGGHDPVLTQRRMRVEDEDRDELREVHDAMDRLAPDGSWLRAAAVERALGNDARLRNLVAPWGTPSARTISRKLSTFVGQVHSGRTLTSRTDPHDKVTEFRVEEVAP